VVPGSPDDKEARIDLGELPAGLRFVGILAMFPREDDKGTRKLLLSKDDLGTVLRVTGYHITREK
jgi:hypothetical protein